jgi:hypothetical protein
MLIQELVRHDSIIASQRLVVEFCNKIGPLRPSMIKSLGSSLAQLAVASQPRSEREGG